MQLPFIQVRNKTKYSVVHYDLITYQRENGGRLSLEGYKAAYLLNWLYIVPNKDHYGIGRVVGWINTSKELYEELTERLYQALKKRQNRITIDPSTFGWNNDEKEFNEQINEWIKSIKQIPDLVADSQKAEKLKLPLTVIGWDIINGGLMKVGN